MFPASTGAYPGRDPTPKGGGGGVLQTPKLSHGTMCFVGATGAGDFVLGIRQGEFFLFDPMCLYSKYSEFRGEFKNGRKAQKRLCSHLAHFWATSDSAPCSEAEGIPQAAGVM